MQELIHPFADTGKCVDRLYREFIQHGTNLIVAFDFDNTIFDYHNNGGDYTALIDILKECSDMGFTMLLFTSNEDKAKLAFMEHYCKHYKIKVDFINESPVMKTRKPYYNILLDDRAGLEASYWILKKFLQLCKH